jgi:hypothetical protein
MLEFIVEMKWVLLIAFIFGYMVYDNEIARKSKK